MNKFTIGLAAVLIGAGAIVGTNLPCVMAADAPATSTAPATAAAGDKFYGSVSAVDTKAMTFTVGEQTFVVTAETPMTKADGSTAALADAVVGEPARGTYTTGADGKLNVTKVRFGKKAGGAKGGGKGGGKKKAGDAPAATQQ